MPRNPTLSNPILSTSALHSLATEIDRWRPSHTGIHSLYLLADDFGRAVPLDLPPDVVWLAEVNTGHGFDIWMLRGTGKWENTGRGG